MSLVINLNIFTFILLFCITKQIELYAIIMLFCIIHEAGHLLAGILLKQKIEKIEIMPFGLSVKFKINVEDYNKKIMKANLLIIKKTIIAIAGPITNLLIAIIYIFTKKDILGIENIIAIYSNLLILLFNLIPIYPLDGGRILKNILHIKFGLKKANIISLKLNKIVIIIITAISSIVIYYFKNIAIFFIILFLWGLVLSENKKQTSKLRLYQTIWGHLGSSPK